MDPLYIGHSHFIACKTDVLRGKSTLRWLKFFVLSLEISLIQRVKIGAFVDLLMVQETSFLGYTIHYCMYYISWYYVIDQFNCLYIDDSYFRKLTSSKERFLLLAQKYPNTGFLKSTVDLKLKVNWIFQLSIRVYIWCVPIMKYCDHMWSSNLPKQW